MPKCNTVYLCMVVGVVFALITSCSGGGSNLTSPGDKNPDGRSTLQGRALTPADWVGHEPMVFCTLAIDAKNKTVQVLEDRTIAAHWNVRPLLEDPLWCPMMNCITVYLTHFDPLTNIYTIDVHLRNPSNMVGYDVRGIMFLKPVKPIALMNPDDYIDLYDPLYQINPFRSFAKTAPNRQFPPASEYNEIYNIYIPPPPPLFNINYAIDVSFPGNCREPYDIEDIEYAGNLTPKGGSGEISCKVYDHQDDIESVKVDLTAITGGIEDLAYDALSGEWSVDITNSSGAPEGSYKCLMSAMSTDYHVKLYNYVTVEVVPSTEDQYIKGRVFDAYNMFSLDGAEVSVVNQDIFGFQPGSVLVTGGEYQVPIEPGIYDMQVSTVGYDIMTCKGVDVPPDETYEIDFGLNMVDISNYNPYPYTGGVTGKVTDAITGEPIPDAAVIINSFDINLYSSPHPTFTGGAGCKDSGYYSATYVCASSDNYAYIPAYSWGVYCSAPGYESSELSGFMLEDDIVVPNMHFQLNPIESGKTVVYKDDFESGVDWTYSDYSQTGTGDPSQWHVQKWDASIVNFCVTNGWSYLAPDETDGGIIPEPNISAFNPGPNDYYLWYGRSDQGCFLGAYDPGLQSPGMGGSSSNSEGSGGYAVSPAIDLSSYSNGKLALESWWEIESENSSTFDFCEIFIRADSGADYSLAFLNPAKDPTTQGDPISSGGSNRDGVWDHLVYDITPYMGNTNAHIVFRFYTADGLYNGFKGWFLDNVYVYGY